MAESAYTTVSGVVGAIAPLHSEGFRDLNEKAVDLLLAIYHYDHDILLYAVLILIILLATLSFFVAWFFWLQSKFKRQNIKLHELLNTSMEKDREVINRGNFLDSFFTHLPFAAFITDEDGLLLRCNKALKDQLGLSDKQLVNVYNLRTDPILEQQGFKDLITTVFTRGKTINFTCTWSAEEYPLADLGSEKSVVADVTIFPIFNVDSKITNAVTVWLDVKNHIMMLKELQKSEKRYEELFNNAPLAYQPLDNKGCFLVVNKTWLKLFGYNQSEIVGKWLGDYISEDDSPFKVVQNILKNPEVHNVEFQIICKDGSRRDVSLSSNVTFDNEGLFRRFHCILRDITETKRIEEQLRQSEKMQAVGQLAGGIAHDFNNQLAIISGYTELIIPRIMNHKIDEFVHNIAIAAEHAADLTNKLLAFSRKGKYLTIPVDIHSIINEVSSILKHSIDKRIKIIQELNATMSTCTGDPSQLQNVFLNLALNARDAMPNGGTITFTTSETHINNDYCEIAESCLPPGDYVQVEVSDTGCGLSLDVQKKIFEPFFTTKPEGKGTGMGLASAYGTIRNHNGSISVYSDLGNGTTFMIYLPVSCKNATRPVQLPATKHPKQSTRVLVVDDESMLRKICSDMLLDIGCQVTTCTNGLEAIDYYKDNVNNIDLVILDMVMPVLGGHETFQQLRKINPKVRAILSSGYSLNGETQRILDEGIMAFIGKPFRKEELAATIAKVCNNQ